MSIFENKEERDEKKIERLNRKMEKLGLKELDILEKNQTESIIKFLSNFDGCDFVVNEDDNVATVLTKAQIEQNWLLLKKLDNIEKELKKLNK